MRELAAPDRRHAGRFLGWVSAGLVALVVGAVGFAVLLAGVTTGSPLVGLDRRIASALNAAVAGRPVVVDVLSVVTTLGDSLTAWVVLSTLTIALLVRRQPRLAGYVAVTGLGAAVLSPAIKELVGRLRPVVEDPVATATGGSFPSGHTLAATVTYGVLLLVFLPILPRRARLPAIVATVALVLVVAFTRLALGVHFLSDVLAGLLLGVVWLVITTTAFRAWRRDRGRAVPGLTEGLAPEAAPALAPAPDGSQLPRPGRRAAELAVGWVLVLGLLLGLGWLITEPLADTAVHRLDTAVVEWLVAHRTPAWTAVADLTSQLGSTRFIVATSLVAAALAAAVTRQWRPVLFLAVVMLGEATLFLASASVIDRSRPPVDHLGPSLPPTSSFPSGHMSAAIALYGGVAVLVLTRVRAWWRWLALAGAVLAAALVAFARLYYGVHYPSDLLGSVVLAVAWLAIAARAAPPGRRAGTEPP